MDVLMMIAVLICNQGATLAYKKFSLVSDENQRGAPVFIAFWTGMLGLILAAAVLIITGEYRLSPVTAVAGIIGGLCFAAAGILYVHIMATGPFIWSVIMMNVSKFIPVLYAALALGEAITLAQVVGVLLIMSILSVMNIGQQGDSRPFTMRWMVLATACMVINGAMFSAQKAQSHHMAGEELLQMLSLLFLSSAASAGIYSFLTLKRGEWPPVNTLLPPALGLVGCVGIGNVLTMALMPRIPAAIQFPITVGCGIVLSAVLGVLLYQERPGPRLYLSIALLTVGAVLLGM